MKKVEIYTDGSCLSNPGRGGYGAIIVFGKLEKTVSGGERETTNNRMEIMSVIAALEALNQPCEADIYTDSRYVADSVEKGWAESWRKKNWIKSDRKPALNSDLWEKLLGLLKIHKVKFHWIKGHAGHQYNERCDLMAKAEAEKF